MVRGWAEHRGRPVLALAVSVGGSPARPVAPGSEARPDVAAALGNPALAGAGWRVEVSAEGLRPGPAEIKVWAWTDETASPVVIEVLTVEVLESGVSRPGGDDSAGRWTVALDRPAPGQAVGPVVSRLEGWAIHEPEPIDRIDIVVDGRRAGSARRGIYRADLATGFDDARTAVSGFEFLLDATQVPLEGSEVKIQVVARVGGAPPAVVAERVASVARPFERPAGVDDDRATPAAVRRPHHGREFHPVVFTHQLDYGGAQLWLQEALLRMGAGRSFPCRVVAFRNGPLAADLRRHGIAVHVTEAPPVDDAGAYEGRIQELMHLLAAGEHSAVLVNTVGCFAGADAGHRLGLPVVWGIHESLSPPAYFPAAYAEPAHRAVVEASLAALAAAQAVVFESEATRRIYEPWTGPDRTAVVPYGVDTGRITDYLERTDRDEVRRALGIAPATRVALVMGTIEPRKSQTLIAEAFERIRDRHPQWTIIFVGDRGGPYATGFKAFVAEAGLGARVRIEPVVADAYPWYRSADVLLSASDLESLPRSAIESMAFGVPVLSTAVFGVPELIDDGVTGFLFEPNDSAALAGALDRVFAADPARLAGVGRAAQELALRAYDSAGYAADLRALLEGLAAGGDRPPADILARDGRMSSR